MITLREAAQQALEALEKYRKMMFVEAGCRFGEGDAAITDLRAALAEPVQEPVAYSVGRTLYWHEGKGVSDAQLYLAPPQRKPLTDDEIDRLTVEQWGIWNYPLQAHRAYARAIERAHGIGGSDA